MVFWWVMSVLISTSCDSCPRATQPLAGSGYQPVPPHPPHLAKPHYIFNGNKYTWICSLENKNVCLVFTALPGQGSLGKRVSECKYLPGVPLAQPRGLSGTGGPSWLSWHQLYVCHPVSPHSPTPTGLYPPRTGIAGTSTEPRRAFLC